MTAARRLARRLAPALIAMVGIAIISVATPARAEDEPARDGIPAVGGRVYKTRIDAGGASIALYRYAAAEPKTGGPIFIVPELLCARSWYDGFARVLQERGREVFLFEWRGSGQSGKGAQGFGDLASLFLGDAPAAFDAALAASGAKSMELVGHGLGGAAAVLLASSARGEHVSSLALFSVPGSYEVPNEALRRFIAAVRAQPAPPESVQLGPFAAMPVPLGDPDHPGQWMELQTPLDLFALILAHGTALTVPQADALRAGLGSGTPGLFAEVAHWMESGDLRLGEGPRAPAQNLSDAWGLLAQPALLVAAPFDNLVHPEHALARRVQGKVVRDTLVLQRIEGFPEDAGHLALQSPWGPRVLAPRLLEWFAEHP